jgi:hypothetical protein
MEDVMNNLVRLLNDVFRSTFNGGTVVISRMVASLERAQRYQVINAVRDCCDFTKDNDPHGEHDMGFIKIFGETYIWVISYYDKTMLYASPDSSDPTVTVRVLTIMHASEY